MSRRRFPAGLSARRRQAMLEGPLGANAERASPGALLRGYRGFATLAQWALPLVVRHRVWRGKEEAARTGERYGLASRTRPAGPLTWFHASSVGETNAVLPVMGELSRRRPDMTLLLTTVTRTSAELAEKRLPENAVHQFVPFDTPRYMSAFLDHWRPGLAVLTESEIWPNLILEAGRRDIPLILVNGRISDRSFQSWRRWRSIARPLFEGFQVVLAQNEALAERFRQLGARKVIAAGNLKIDAPAPEAPAEALDHLKKATAGRTIFLAASTHPGEEQAVVEAHRILAESRPELLTIIAPRHPHRGGEVAETVQAAGLTPSLRSLGDRIDPATDVYIADTIGELGLFYALAPLAFVGGSLAARGGQNPVEAVRHGAVVLSGPGVENFQDAYDTLRREGGCIEVASAEELAARADELLQDDSRRKAMLENGNRAVQSMSGALDATLQALADWLPPQRG